MNIHLIEPTGTPENHSKTVALTGYVYLQDFGAGIERSYVLFSNERMADRHYTLIGPVYINYEVPASFDHAAAQIAALEEEKAELRAAFQTRLTEINDRINKLQALEMTVEA